MINIHKKESVIFAMMEDQISYYHVAIISILDASHSDNNLNKNKELKNANNVKQRISFQLEYIVGNAQPNMSI